MLAEVLVGTVGQRHDVAHGVGEAACLVVFGQAVGGCGEILEHRGLRELLREPSAELLLDEAGAAAGDVDDLADQVAVDPGDEVVQVEIDVADVGRKLGSEVVTQMLRIEVAQVGAGLDEGAGGLRHFLAVDGQEAMAPHRVRGPVSGTMQQGGPEQGVEVGDVLADEVIQFDLAVGGPVPVEVKAAFLAQVQVAGHVADRGVEPDVEVLAGGPRDLEAEVRRVAADVPVAQPGLEPFVELVLDFRLHAAVRSPLFQEVGKVAEPEEQVFGFPQLRGRVAERRARVAELGRIIGRAALLASIPVLVFGAAARAGAAQVAVGEEQSGDRVEELRDRLAPDVAGLGQGPEDAAGQLAVFFAVRAVVPVEIDQEISEILAVLLADLFDQLLWADAALLREQHDRRSVRVVCADVEAVFAAQALVARPDVGLQVFHQVAQMNRPVGVGQGAGDQDAARGGHRTRGNSKSHCSGGESREGTLLQMKVS